MFRTRFSISDALVSVAVVLLALILFFLPFFFSSDDVVLVVTTPDGSREYALSDPRVIEVQSNGITLQITVENGRASVTHSDCQDGVCRVSPPISRVGESILCAPAGVLITVKGGGTNVDYIAG